MRLSIPLLALLAQSKLALGDVTTTTTEESTLGRHNRIGVIPTATDLVPGGPEDPGEQEMAPLPTDTDLVGTDPAGPPTTSESVPAIPQTTSQAPPPPDTTSQPPPPPDTTSQPPPPPDTTSQGPPPPPPTTTPDPPPTSPGPDPQPPTTTPPGGEPTKPGDTQPGGEPTKPGDTQPGGEPTQPGNNPGGQPTQPTQPGNNPGGQPTQPGNNPQPTQTGGQQGPGGGNQGGGNPGQGNGNGNGNQGGQPGITTNSNGIPVVQPTGGVTTLPGEQIATFGPGGITVSDPNLGTRFTVPVPSGATVAVFGGQTLTQSGPSVRVTGAVVPASGSGGAGLTTLSGTQVVSLGPSGIEVVDSGRSTTYTIAGSTITSADGRPVTIATYNGQTLTFSGSPITITGAVVPLPGQTGSPAWRTVATPYGTPTGKSGPGSTVLTVGSSAAGRVSVSLAGLVLSGLLLVWV